MSNTATIKGDSTVLWGTRGKVGSSVTGYLQSVRDQLTGDMVEIKDEDGFTVTVVLFNDKNECEVVLIVKTSFPVFARGDEVTIAGIAGVIVLNYEKTWDNGKTAQYNLKGTKWSGIAASA